MGREGSVGDACAGRAAGAVRWCRAALAALSLAVCAAVGATPAAGQLPPDAPWRTFDTPHFRVTYPDALEPTARRAADRAERAYATLAAELLDPPRGKIELVVTDHIDVSNGYATPFPTNRVVVYAHPPVGEPSLAYYDDWLHLVILHELVHVFHLDTAGGVWEGLRSVFGRSPALFPGVLTPGWLVEGLATAYESRLTAGGRVRGSLYEMMLRTAVLGDALFTIDRASADPVRWPGGTTRYLYGAFFVDHLARVHGTERVARFVEEYGGRLVPYRLNAAARETFGTSLDEAWDRWADSLRVRYAAQADSVRALGLTEPERLTTHGRGAYHPRFSPGGDAIAYLVATGRDEPAIRVLPLPAVALPGGAGVGRRPRPPTDGGGIPGEGAEGGERRSGTERNEGRDIARATVPGPLAWLPDGSGVMSAQLDYVDGYRLYADLRIDGVAGGGRRLTRGARVWDPDLHPDGRTVVAVTDAGGTNALALLELTGAAAGTARGPERTTPAEGGPPGADAAAVATSRRPGVPRILTPPDLDVHWSLPRWSPDGSRIAVGRWSAGGRRDVVVLDTVGNVVRELTADRALDGAPAWSPDGRYVVFVSDRTGIANIYAFDLEDGALWQVTNLLTGASHPDVSPDGEWIVFALYGVDGYDIARIPFDPAGWRPAPPARDLAPLAARRGSAPAAPAAPSRPYSPLPSVLPAAWSLVLEGGGDLGIGIGASANGEDVVGRHSWATEIVVHGERLRTGAGAAYRYAGLGRPVVDVAAAQRWDVRVARGQAVVDGEPIGSAVLERERSVAAGLGWVQPRWGASTWLEGRVELNDVDLRWDEPEAAGDVELVEFPKDVGAVAVAGYSSARSYGLSPTPQDGVTLVGQLEGHRYLSPFEGESARRGYLRGTARTRLYHSLPLPGFARHVLAFRADGGAEAGSLSPGFGVGGASGGSAPIPLDIDLLGGGLAFPVRGYAAGTQHGNRAFAAAAEYRFPIALVERGLGLVPLSIGRIWGDLFLDAGSAWCAGPDACVTRIGGSERVEPLYSVGGELVFHLRVGFLAELPVRIGGAVPLTRGPESRRPSLHLRLGRSF